MTSIAGSHLAHDLQPIRLTRQPLSGQQIKIGDHAQGFAVPVGDDQAMNEVLGEQDRHLSQGSIGLAGLNILVH
jgi:hypothetical protein